MGVGVVLGPGVELGGATLSGGLAAVAAAVFAGGAVTSARQLRLSETSVLVTTHFMGVGAVVTAPAILRGLPPISPVVFLVLAGVVLTSLGGQLLLHEGLGFVSATEGSLAAATSVAVATGLQAVWLGEQIGRASLLGAGLLFAAVAVAAGRGSARGSALRARAGDRESRAAPARARFDARRRGRWTARDHEPVRMWRARHLGLPLLCELRPAGRRAGGRHLLVLRAPPARRRGVLPQLRGFGRGAEARARAGRRAGAGNERRSRS